MTIHDPIADLFTQIRNAQIVSFDSVVIQYSTIKHEIAKLLTKEGYLNGVEIVNKDIKKKTLKIALKYDSEGSPLFDTIKRISKPSKRVYTKKKDIYKVLNGFGTLILSTPFGIMTGKEARLKNVGGEIIGEIY
jgi:small subunit ribosomal protein S8